jgi:integrase/recombinase XerC
MTDRFLRYITYERRYSQHTLTAYQTDLAQFEQFLAENHSEIKIEQAQHLHIRGWILHLIEVKTSARSVNRKLATLRSLYKFLRKQGLLDKDPMVRIQALKTSKNLPQFVQEAEMDNLLDRFPFTEDFYGLRDRLVLELLYGLGIRQAELITMRTEDVKLAEATVKVLGKRNKERVLPIPGSVVETIKKYLQAKQQFLEAPYAPQLLVTDSGDAAYPMFIYRLVKKYLQLFTTADKQSPHILRHTFATHLLNRGADLNAVKDLLGHSSLAATQVYTHNSMEKLKKVFDQAHPKA